MSGARFAVLTAVLGLALGVFLSWPLVLHLQTAVLDDGSLDAFQFAWNVWWVQESLLALHRHPFYTHYLYYPEGVPLLFHTGSFALGALALPLTIAAGPLVAMNLLVLTAPALTFVVIAALAREATRDPWAALVAGLLGTMTPLAIWVLPVIYLSCAWIPPAMLLLWWALQRRREWWLVGATLALLAFAVFASQEYAMLAVAVLGLDTVVRLALARRLGLPRLWLPGTLAFGLLAAALLGTLAAIALAQPARPPSSDHALLGSGFVAGFLTPPWLARWRFAFARIFYLGTWTLLLAALALPLAPRRALYWLLLALPALCMVLGPYLRVHHPLLELPASPGDAAPEPGIPGPYLLLADLVPLLRFLRAPYRWMTAVNPLLAILAATAVAALRERTTHTPAWRAAVTAAAIAGALVVPILETRGLRAPLVSAAVPEAYAVVRDDPQEAALLDLPSGFVQGGLALFSSRYMYYQTVHRKFLLEGTVSRLPADRRFVLARGDLDFSRLPWLKYVVVHRDLLAEAHAPSVQQTAALVARAQREGRLVARDATTEVYELGTFRPETVWSPRTRGRSAAAPGHEHANEHAQRCERWDAGG